MSKRTPGPTSLRAIETNIKKTFDGTEKDAMLKHTAELREIGVIRRAIAKEIRDRKKGKSS